MPSSPGSATTCTPPTERYHGASSHRLRRGLVPTCRLSAAPMELDFAQLLGTGLVLLALGSWRRLLRRRSAQSPKSPTGVGANPSTSVAATPSQVSMSA
jgi:hypothetical protein